MKSKLGVNKVKESVKRFQSASGKIDKNMQAYLKSYEYYLDYFGEVKEFDSNHVIVAASFAYTWMPTTLKWKQLNEENLLKAAKELTEAKKIKSIAKVDIGEFDNLRGIITNSYVGASKALHFVNPEVFPIYDSNIFKYIFREDLNGNAAKWADVNSKEYFNKYISSLSGLVKQKSFERSIYIPVNKCLSDISLGKVSKVRAAELVIFHHQREDEKARRKEKRDAKKNE